MQIASKPERQYAILEFLCRSRHETIDNLAGTFGVSRSTIRRDILALSCRYPLRIVCGHYGGGVYVEEWFRMDRKYMSKQQITLLKKLMLNFEGEDLQVMKSILSQFALQWDC